MLEDPPHCAGPISDERYVAISHNERTLRDWIALRA